MNSSQSKKLEKLVRGSLIASNYIRKNLYEGKSFDDLEFLDTIRDWIVEDSGFNKDVVLESMRKFYNEIKDEKINSKSLLETLLLSEYRIRVDKKYL
jgi:hypothetical protein